MSWAAAILLSISVYLLAALSAGDNLAHLLRGDLQVLSPEFHGPAFLASFLVFRLVRWLSSEPSPPTIWRS